MVLSKKKGYRTERKIKIIFENKGWTVTRAGASLGEADLICLKNGKCLLIQVKSTRKKTLYYRGYMKKKLTGFPFFVVVDFGYGKIRILKPQKKIEKKSGMSLDNFLKKINKLKL